MLWATAPLCGPLHASLQSADCGLRPRARGSAHALPGRGFAVAGARDIWTPSCRRSDSTPPSPHPLPLPPIGQDSTRIWYGSQVWVRDVFTPV